MANVVKSPPPQGPSSTTPAPAEIESLKRSTDCVFFLGFPSSCNKGSECEYRHSEAARSNPTDCWYWLSGKCTLNAKCAFRHPPLDLLGPPQTGNYAVPLAPVHRSGPPFVSTPQNASTQAVPCVFFQRGQCVKGARCTFSHGILPPANTKVKSAPSTTGSMEAPSFKKTFRVPEKGANPTMTFHSNASKPTEITRQPQVKPVDARLIEATPAAEHYAHPAVATRIDGNGSLRSRGTRPLRATSVEDQNGRDFDDSMRESSPGFDVLVDDEKVGEDEYYDDEDQYVRMRGQEGRRSNELEIGRQDDYNSVTDVDRDFYRGKQVYDTYDHLRDKYAREQRDTSFERPSAHDRRGPYKRESPDFIQNSSDLRHRLSKQRSGNDLRSVVSPDYKPNYRQEDREYWSSQRDTRSPVRESSLGGRLQGRIKIPRRSPANVSNIYSERDNDRGRYLDRRVSPSRPQRSSIHSRLRDRMRERTQEGTNYGRNFRGEMRNDSAFQGNVDAFAGPRRLSELRGAKHTDKQSVSGGKFRDSVLASPLRTEGDVSFDGPKPLSEILKRKRNAASTASMSVAVNCDKAEGVKQNENDTGKPVAISAAPEPTQSSDVQQEALTAEKDAEDAEISNKKIKLNEDEHSLPENEKDLPDNGEEHVVDGELDQGDGEGEEHELDEGFDQVDGEYDYEQDDVEGYDLTEGDVGDHEGLIDEDDGDDFAKKLGVSF